MLWLHRMPKGNELFFFWREKHLPKQSAQICFIWTVKNELEALFSYLPLGCILFGGQPFSVDSHRRRRRARSDYLVVVSFDFGWLEAPSEEKKLNALLFSFHLYTWFLWIDSAFSRALFFGLLLPPSSELWEWATIASLGTCGIVFACLCVVEWRGIGRSHQFRLFSSEFLWMNSRILQLTCFFFVWLNFILKNLNHYVGFFLLVGYLWLHENEYGPVKVIELHPER